MTDKKTYDGLTESECADNSDGICSNDVIKNKLIEVAGVSGNTEESKIIKEVANKLGTDNCESCVITSEKFRDIAGSNLVDQNLKDNFKPYGPHNDSLLSNINIDEVLDQWAKGSIYSGNFSNTNIINSWKEKFNDFYPFQYHMIDFREHNKPLHTTNFKQLIESGVKTFACVLNTDKYGNGGKHWIAVFGDFRDKISGNNGKPYVAFFNSSGNMPGFPIVQWMKKVKLETGCDIIDTTGLRHQYSKTECGPYCLYFIWKVLNGTPVEWFKKNKVDDNIVLNFRKRVFRKCR